MLAELITTTTADGIELDGALYRAAGPGGPGAQILMIHGQTWNFYQGPSRWLPPLLAQAGYTCLSLNMRDHDLPAVKDFDLAHHDLRAGVDFLFAQGAPTVGILAHGYACSKVICYPAHSADDRIGDFILTTLGSVKRIRPEFWATILQGAGQLRGRVLVVQGASDASLEGRARADELEAAAPNARVTTVLLDGGNHYFDHLHAELAESVLNWLASTRGRPEDRRG